jgi:hypothetical protein
MSNEITPVGSACPVYIQEMSAEQIAADKAEAKAQAKVRADREALKAATLAKLGLTADEVAALLS